MKKVLLFADIGGHGHRSYYHVGDEAMFIETYSWYKKTHPSWQLSTLSWSLTHTHLELKEQLHLFWKKPGIIYFPLLLIKLLIWKLFSLSLFSIQELALVKTIEDQDRIHFTGGGNLSSQFRPWLYYCFFIMIAAKYSDKEILLTSQTIGPIKGIDQLFASIVFTFPKLIGIRSRIFSSPKHSKVLVSHSEVIPMLDAAYYLPIHSSGLSRKSSRTLTKKIGLSIHVWEDWEKSLLLLIQQALELVAKKYDLTVHLIPHHLDPNGASDLEYMSRLKSKLKNKLKINKSISVKKILEMPVPAEHIKQLTAESDVVLTTRYHGIIFGLSKNVPTIALNFDKYYQQKNLGAYEMIYEKSFQVYVIDITATTAHTEVAHKILTLLNNHKLEKQKLRLINKDLKQKVETLDSVMKKYESLTR